MSLKINENTVPISCGKLLTPQSKAVVAVATIAAVCAIVFIALGIHRTFGTQAHVFYPSVVGGSLVTLISLYVLKRVLFTQKVISEDALISQLRRARTLGEFGEILRAISSDFFRDKSQERAKRFFAKVMKDLFGGEVLFPKAGPLVSLSKGNLKPNVFELVQTDGVQNDIFESSNDKFKIHLYQVASQYNAAEAAGPFTPPVGDAMSASETDYTQGPLAQRTNPRAFELVTAFLTHLGFNMLDQVLPSAGTTYDTGSLIQHGYLRPTDETIEQLTAEFSDNYSKAEYVCYSSWPGPQPVYILLQAAPAIGYAGTLVRPSDELQQYAALANYLALFRQGIALARETKKPIVIHATAVGGGVFGNKTQNLEWGFKQAALATQDEMEALGIKVHLKAFGDEGPLHDIAKNLIPS